MANKKISDLSALTSVASGDLLEIVDISDTTDSAEGSSKKITQTNLTAPERVRLDNLETVVNNASASAPASLDLHEDTDNGTNKITITAPSAIASDKVITLPDETGEVITDASTELTLGWNVASGTWSASDANTISVASLDLTGVLQKGDKIKLTNDSATKYFYITTTPAFSTNTTFDVTGETDLAAGDITSPYYSKIDTPQGFKNGRDWYKCRVYANTAQNATSGGTTKINFDTEVFDVGDNFDTTNKRFVAPITGFYRVDVKVNVITTGSTAAGAVVAQLYVNGGLVANGTHSILGSGASLASEVSDIVYAEKGQYIEGYVRHTSGANDPINVGFIQTTFMGVQFVSI